MVKGSIKTTGTYRAHSQFGKTAASCADRGTAVNTSLIGTYTHNLDEKGRMAVPAKLRIELGDPFYIACLGDTCLTAFSEEEWHKFAEKLSAIPQSAVEAQRAVRMIFSGACKCEPDKQGRVLLPQILREKVGIDKEVVMIGAYTRAEIWAKDRWAAFEQEAGGDSMASLSEFGI